jgi:hypothetical protein
MKFIVKTSSVKNSEFHGVDGIIQISHFAGRKEKGDRLLNVYMTEKEAEKLVEDLMRAIAEVRLGKFPRKP